MWKDSGHGWEEAPGSSAARFHLKSGRILVFRAVPRTVIRRRAGEILFTLIVLTAAAIAATLFASPRPGHGSAPRAASAARSDR
jgi:hypothetical protein